jgi:hypothetical protein
MNPQEIGITTTYKMRVATLKPCKEHCRILIGQLADSRLRATFADIWTTRNPAREGRMKNSLELVNWRRFASSRDGLAR